MITKLIVTLTLFLLIAAPDIARAEYPYSKPVFSGCFESYLENLIRQASVNGNAEGEHMGYDIAMIRYIDNQQCVIDVAIYSHQNLVDRRMVYCVN